MRFILYPFSIIYGIITSTRNLLFDYKLLKSKIHNIPIICIGNLSVGGSGKTPHTNYIAHLLSQKYKVAILSRGYARKSKGFFYVTLNSEVDQVGDEPLELKQNNPNCIVAVNCDRNKGVKKILADYPKTNVILLDDGFQHRWIKAGLNIILTPFDKPYISDYLLPRGTLRENIQGISRADIIIVSKTPIYANSTEKKELISSFNLKAHQKKYFSSINYQKYKCLVNNTELEDEEKYSVTLACGIENINPLVNHLQLKGIKLKIIKFTDHHSYTLKNIKDILSNYHKDKSIKKLILTTEKDATKIRKFSAYFKDVNIYYIPINIIINNKKKFEKELIDYVKKN